MRVIFVEDVVNVARTGDVKEVKTGFIHLIRPFLIPKIPRLRHFITDFCQLAPVLVKTRDNFCKNKNPRI